MVEAYDVTPRGELVIGRPARLKLRLDPSGVGLKFLVSSFKADTLKEAC